MSKYSIIRRKALLLLNNTPIGERITEPDELAAYFSEEISLTEFLKNVYNQRLANILQSNKSLMKANLRNRWFFSGKVKAQENLYKLLATSDELQRLKGEGQVVETSGSDPLLEALNPQEIWSR